MNPIKVKSVQDNGTWQGQHGLMYKQEVTLEDGRTGEVSAKTQGKWKVGDIVEVTKFVQSQHGPRMSLSYVSAYEHSQAINGKPKTFVNNDDRQKQINVSWAIGQAIALGYNESEAIKDHARKLLKVREDLLNETENHVEAKTEDIPF